MPSFYEVPVALATVFVAGGMIDPNTRTYGCTVTRDEAGRYSLQLAQPASGGSVSVQVSLLGAASAGVGVLTDFSFAKVTRLPTAGDPVPFTRISIETAGAGDGVLADRAFCVRVDRVTVGSAS